jgi:hypothetical protein
MDLYGDDVDGVVVLFNEIDFYTNHLTQQDDEVA